MRREYKYYMYYIYNKISKYDYVDYFIKDLTKKNKKYIYI